VIALRGKTIEVSAHKRQILSLRVIGAGSEAEGTPLIPPFPDASPDIFPNSPAWSCTKPPRAMCSQTLQAPPGSLLLLLLLLLLLRVRLLLCGRQP
jgi:hypothetical protein